MAVKRIRSILLENVFLVIIIFPFAPLLQVASLLSADHFWKKVTLQWPQVFGRENPFNNQIKEVFGDQGGH